MSTCCLVLLLALGALSPERARAAPEGLTCEACIVVDGRGRVLWGRAADTPLPNASTTKMVTAILVAEAAELDDEVTVSTYAASTGGGGLDLGAGDRYSVEALLYALLLSSSNDAAVALAEHVSGSEAAFVDEMNSWLHEKGLDDTSFVTPHGLDMPGHEATASDLSAVGNALLKKPLLAEIVATSETSVEGPDGLVFLENRNVLLETYKGAVGIKTGMTLGAGEVLVAAARRKGDLVIAVAMRSLDAAADARVLLDYGFKRLRQQVELRAGAAMGEIVLDPAGTVPLTLGKDVAVLAPRKRIEYATRVDSLPEIVEAGDMVGTIDLVFKDKTLATAPLLAGDDVDPPETSLWIDLLETLLRFGGSVGRVVGAE